MNDPISLVDSWIAGDQIKDFEFTAYKKDGTTFDFTGYTGLLVGRSRDNRANVVSVACTFPGAGVSKVASLGTVLTLTAGARRELYVCSFKWTRTSDSKLLRSPRFALAIEADPANL